MASTTKSASRPAIFNLPNQLTVARLALAIVLFFLIAWKYYTASMVVFLVAAGTDWLDGYFARKYGLVTVLGRILDPFADKVIICGTYIFLCAIPDSGIHAWMAVVIMGRELLVTALRSFLEQQGADFSASMSGKLKMVLQCAAAAISLFCLAYASPGPPPTMQTLLLVSVWGALLLTVYSGVEYVRTAIHLMRHQ